MPAVITYVSGIFYINGVRAEFPKDGEHQPAPCLMGLNYVDGSFVPLSSDATGKLQIGATIEVEDIEIGAVELKDTGTDIRVNVEADGGKNSVYVQSVSLSALLTKVVDDSVIDKKNIHSDFTYYTSGYGIGKLATIKEFPTGAAGGTPAKLTTYVYDSSARVSSIEVTNTVV